MTRKMYIVIAIVLGVSIFITVKSIRAQAHVDSTAYDLMLSTLLKHDVQEISVDSFKQQTGCIILDARAYDEYRVSHITNAIWVGYDDFDISRTGNIPKEAKVVVYCSVGYRSEKITQRLNAAGYSDVSNLYGGIFEWVNQGNTVVDMQGSPTEKVHPYSKSWGIWLNKGIKSYE